MTGLALALLAFVGTHFLMSHPLRAPMVARLGAGGFMAVYVLVSFATLGWAASAFRQAPLGEPLWIAGGALWVPATLLMLLGSILFAGSLAGNPALPDPRGAQLAMGEPHGVLAITRHPMMWGFTAWAVTHALVSPRPPVLLLTTAIAVLALGGAAGQDAKKRVLMGNAWTHWVSRTAFVPFAGQLGGRIGWAAAWPGWVVLIGGTALWLVATWAHPLGGAGVAAGIWRWL